MTGDKDSFSHVSDVNMDVQQDKSPSSSIFEIEVKATFIIVERNSNTGFLDEMFVEAGRIISQVIHEFPLGDLIDDGNGAVSDMLNSMRVPVQPSMVEEIAATAVRLAVAARDRESRVLRMQVEIEAVVNDVPDFGSDDTDNEDDDDDNDEGTVTTAEEMAENVGKLVVEESGKDCPICLEELVAGCEAACMPCSHVFHQPCIMTWLNKKKRCPCCRSKLCNDV